MKKLHSLAFYTLVTPVIALSSSVLLAEQAEDMDVGYDKQNAQHDRGDKLSGSQPGADRDYTRDESRMENRGYLSSAPANSMQASELIGTEVQTSGDEEVGSVSDLIIDKNGQVVAVVVGVGGFLGMGEKDVAIGWDEVTPSGAAEDKKLRIDVTREKLRSAPAFETQE